MANKKQKELKIEDIDFSGVDNPTSSQNLSGQAPELTSDDLKEVEREIQLEKEYGDKDLQTFGEAALSSATFGISDQVLTKTGLATPEALRERRERNKAAGVAGEVAGIAAPLILSGGTSAAAKGVGALGKGVTTAAKIGTTTEQLTAKALKKIIAETGNKKIATEIIKKAVPKSAGSAVEGAFYGAGQLISEDALEKNELSAENLISSVGVGALLGGTAGGVFGAAEALVPVVKNGKVVDYVSKKIGQNVDDKLSAAKLSGLTPSKITKLKERSPQVYDNLPKYYRENLNLKTTDSIEKLFKKSNEQLTKLGNDIGNTLKELDSVSQGKNILPTKSEVASRIQNTLKAFKEEFENVPSTAAKRNLAKINREIDTWDTWAKSNDVLKGTDIQKLKVNLQKLAKWERNPLTQSLDEKMAKASARAVREELFNVADKASTFDANIAKKLRQQNLDYGTAQEVTNSLKSQVDKEASKDFVGFKDLLIADIFIDTVGGVTGGLLIGKKFLESDLRRKLTILAKTERRNQQVSNKISSSLGNFISGVKKVSIPTSTKILLKSDFSKDLESGKSPKTKKEAFNNVKENLFKLTNDAEALQDKLYKTMIRLNKTMPKTAEILNQKLVNAINFLQSKLPKDNNISGSMQLFNRKWEPSTIQLAKFERYLEAVENPLSALEDLESGSLTREKVEAIKVVYPEIYIKLQEVTMEKIAENPDKIGYNKRIQLGILLDIPTDSSLMPENISGLQQTFIDEAQQGSDIPNATTSGAVNTTQGGLNKLNFDKSAATPLEKTLTRE